MSKRVFVRRAALSLISLGLLGAADGFAQSFEWDGGTGADRRWGTAANWNPDGIPGSTPGVGTATFAFTSPGIVDLFGGSFGPTSVTFTGGDYTIADTGAAAGALSTNTLNMSGGATNTISARLNSLGAAPLAGTVSVGTLRLTNTTNAIAAGSTFTVSGGATLSANGSGTSSAIGNAKVVLQSGAILRVVGGDLNRGLSNATAQFYTPAASGAAGTPVRNSAAGVTGGPNIGWSVFDNFTNFNTTLNAGTPAVTTPLVQLGTPIPINFPEGDQNPFNGGTNDEEEDIFLPTLGVDLYPGADDGRNTFVTRFTGKLNVANPGATDFFVEANDGAVMFVDLDQSPGTNWTMVANNNRFGDVGVEYLGRGTTNPGAPALPQIAPPVLLAGQYDFAVGYYNAGPIATQQAGVEVYWTPAGGQREIIPVTGAAAASYTAANLTANDVDLTASATIEVQAASGNLGHLRITPGADALSATVLTAQGVAGAAGRMSFTQATVNAPGFVTFNTPTAGDRVTIGQYHGNAGGAVNVLKAGIGEVILDHSTGASTNTATTTFDVMAGALAVKNSVAGGNPLGSAKVVLNGGVLNMSPVGDPATAVTTSLPGFRGDYYDLPFPGSNVIFTPTSALDALTPNQIVQTPEINFGQTAGNPFAGIGVDVGTEDFAARWSGKINIAAGGPITFYTNSDDGSALFLDLNNDGDFDEANEMIVDNRGDHGMQELSGVATLIPGLYNIRLEFYERGGDAGMIASWNPGTGKTVIPSSVVQSDITTYAPVAFGNNVDVVQPSTIHNGGQAEAILGTLTIGDSLVLTKTGGNGIRFANTNLTGPFGSSAQFTVNAGTLATGVTSDGASTGAITKDGGGTLLLDRAGNDLSNTSISVNAGNLAVGIAGALDSINPALATVSVFPGATLELRATDPAASVQIFLQAGSRLYVAPFTGTATALDRNWTIDPGTTLDIDARDAAGNPSGLTGTGTLSHGIGSIIRASNSKALTGSQLTAASIVPDETVQLNADNIELLNSLATGVIHEALASHKQTDTGDWILNSSAADPFAVHDVLTNSTTNATITDGANQIVVNGVGVVFAATDATTLAIQEQVSVAGGGRLRVGTQNVINGLNKINGTVSFNRSLGGIAEHIDGTLAFGAGGVLNGTVNASTTISVDAGRILFNPGSSLGATGVVNYTGGPGGAALQPEGIEVFAGRDGTGFLTGGTINVDGRNSDNAPGDAFSVQGIADERPSGESIVNKVNTQINVSGGATILRANRGIDSTVEGYVYFTNLHVANGATAVGKQSNESRVITDIFLDGTTANVDHNDDDGRAFIGNVTGPVGSTLNVRNDQGSNLIGKVTNTTLVVTGANNRLDLQGIPTGVHALPASAGLSGWDLSMAGLRIEDGRNVGVQASGTIRDFTTIGNALLNITNGVTTISGAQSHTTNAGGVGGTIAASGLTSGITMNTNAGSATAANLSVDLIAGAIGRFNSTQNLKSLTIRGSFQPLVAPLDGQFFTLTNVQSENNGGDPLILNHFSGETADASAPTPIMNFPNSNANPVSVVLGIPPFGGGNAGQDFIGAMWTGKVRIAGSAAHNVDFFTNSDDGSLLYLDSNNDGVFTPAVAVNSDGDFTDPGESPGEAVVNNLGSHGFQVRQGTLSLAPGEYNIRINWYEGNGGAGIIAEYNDPASGVGRQILTSNLVPASRAELGGTLKTASLTIGNGGVLDMKDQDMIVQATAATKDAVHTQIEAHIVTAQNGLDASLVTKWDGPGITSSTARAANVAQGFDLTGIGVIRNSDLDITTGVPGSSYTSFSGQPVTPDDVLVKYTYVGDGNLNGLVNFDDYIGMDNAFFGLSPNLGWATGDINFDGTINFDDYSKVDQAFFFQGAPLSGEGGGVAAVPEPGTWLLAILGILASLLCLRHGGENRS